MIDTCSHACVQAIGSVFQPDDRLWCAEEFGSPPNTTGRGAYAFDVERWVNATIDKHEQCVWFGPDSLSKIETEAQTHRQDNAAAAASFIADHDPGSGGGTGSAGGPDWAAGGEAHMTFQAATKGDSSDGLANADETVSRPTTPDVSDTPRDGEGLERV